MYNAFALSGRIASIPFTQGDTLGYVLLGFQPVSTVQIETFFLFTKKDIIYSETENGDTLYQNVPVCHLIYDAIDMAQA